MGFISKMTGDQKPFPERDMSRFLWRQVFGGTHKEENLKPQVTPGGTYSRSVLANPEAYKRLLQAMRSMAPGGWTDNRVEESKHFTGIQYVAIHRCGEQMAQATFSVYERDVTAPDGRRRVPENHPLVQLLERPNNDDSFGDLMYNWNMHLDLYGMALTWMVPNQDHIPMELYPIPVPLAIPQPAINPDYPDGYWRIQPLYPYGPFSSYPTPATAVGAPIPAQWMIRMKYPHPLLRYDGYSPMSALKLHIDEVESMDRSRWYSMKRSINPSAVLNFENMDGMEPLPEPEIERIRAEFENNNQGPENAGQLFVATPGAKLEPWGSRPIDMDYQRGWDQIVSFVLGGFGITKPAAGMIDDSSYSTLFATLKQLYWLTLEPKCNRIASKLTRHLAPFFGDNLIVEIKCKRIDDHDVRNAKLDRLMSAKAITKNEMRKELDLAPTNEMWGNDIAGMDPLPPDMQAAMGMNPGMSNPNLQGPPAVGGGVLAGLIPPGMNLVNNVDTVHDHLEGEQSEVAAARPVPGKLGRGALGPRKSFASTVYSNGRYEEDDE